MTAITSTIGDRQYNWHFGEDGSILLEGKKLQIELQKISSHVVSILFNGRSYNVTIDGSDAKYDVLLNAHYYSVSTEDSSKKLVSQMLGTAIIQSSTFEVRSPMPGMLVRCEVEEGAKIKVGDGLLILEAMKMENEIRAMKEGVVKKILVTNKQVVEKGELLLIIE